MQALPLHKYHSDLFILVVDDGADEFTLNRSIHLYLLAAVFIFDNEIR